MDYELYHDESRIDGYWHGVLLVPVTKKSLFLSGLQNIREKTRYYEPLSLKNVKKEGRIFSCAEAWVQFGVGAMMTSFGKNKYPILFKYNKKSKLEYCNYEDEIKTIIGAKFITFREQSNLSSMSDMLDHGGKVETTLRIALKGGLHFLGSEEDPINIVKIHFDGYEHYGRTIDEERLIARISGLRQYCTFSKDIKYIIDERASDHRKDNSQEYEDCQFLQLTDLLIGSFRTAFNYKTNNKGLHERIAEPIKYLIDKYEKGFARMQNSRWKDSFCMSQCMLKNGQWHFEPIEKQEIQRTKQLDLPFNV